MKLKFLFLAGFFGMSFIANVAAGMTNSLPKSAHISLKCKMSDPKGRVVEKDFNLNYDMKLQRAAPVSIEIGRKIAAISFQESEQENELILYFALGVNAPFEGPDRYRMDAEKEFKFDSLSVKQELSLSSRGFLIPSSDLACEITDIRSITD